jgi:transcriptional regulator of acetoin/glycerol metabolism
MWARSPTSAGELRQLDNKIASEPTTLEEAERSHILRILEETKRRLAPAAKILGVPRTTLFYKIRRLGIDLSRSKEAAIV